MSRGTRVGAQSWDTLQVTFAVPTELLGEPTSQAVTTTTARLHIPWEERRLLGHRVSDGVFPISFALLPRTPGRLVMYHEVTTKVVEEQPRSSPTYFFDSSSDDHEENRSFHLSEQDVRDGWRIVPDSWSFELRERIEGDEGHDWYNKGYQASSDVEVVWRVRTEHKTWGHSGKIKWGIACRVRRTIDKDDVVTEEPPLAWCMSRTFSYPAGKWKAIWTRFDGVEQELTATSLSSAFLQIQAHGDSLTLTTYGA